MLYPAPNSGPTGYDMTTVESEILVGSPNKVQRVILYGTSAKLPGPDQAGSHGHTKQRILEKPDWSKVSTTLEPEAI
jgi:hypothetical protein